MRFLPLGASLGLALFCHAQAQDTPDQTSPKSAYAQFQRDNAGDWIAQWHAATGTPSAIYGTGLPLADWRENSLVEARRHALRLLDAQRDLLGLGSSQFTEIIGARMGRTWSFTFDQFFRGLPVIEGRADVRVNMKGVIAMFGSRAWPIADTFDITPTIGEDVAIGIAWDALGAPTGVPQPARAQAPRLVLWGDTHAAVQVPVYLAWEVAVSNVDAAGVGPIGRYYVDAKTGAVLHFINDKHDCHVPGCTGGKRVGAAVAALTAPPVLTTVTLLAWTRTGDDAYSALVNAPLPGVVLNVPGVGNVTTDQNGQFTIDIAAAVNITVGALDGRHHAPITGPNAPSGVFSINPGVNSTIQLLTAAATTNEAAHPTLTYWVDETNEYCRSILGNSAQLATASTIAVQANIASTCNAYYTGNTINFYNQGGGCANTAFSTVIAHEWGHGLDDRYGGIANTNAEGLSEGWADIIGMFLVDSPLLGSGFQIAGTALRRGDNAFLYPYSTSSPHGAGHIWMGFAWRLRERLRGAFGTPSAIAISNDIVISSIVADATTRVDAVREVFIADDDDGNLLNGTPNYAHLSGAAVDKAIPYPEVLVATISHTPLTSTTQRLTPRTVLATVAPITGTINLVRLHYNAGSGNVVRTMHPTGPTNVYAALLPGLSVGGVTYHIEAVHSGGTTVRLPAAGELSYSIDGGTFAGFYFDNFDTGAAGWTNGFAIGSTDWQIGDPAGKAGTQTGVPWADPQFAFSGLNCYANDLGIGASNGRYSANVENYLRSPILNCTGRFGVKLRFKRWLSVEEGAFDQATILVNGIQVWQNPASGHTLDTAWQALEYAIPMADNNPAVQIEWRLKSDAGLSLGGWQIDDVELGESIVPVVDAEFSMLPEQAVQGAAMTLRVFTPGGPRPYLIGLGDAPGPIAVPGFPILSLGGNVTTLGGTTDATGLQIAFFAAPSVPSAIGVFFYSQVLTLDPTFTNWVVSNPFVNLFTQTP